MKIFALVTGTFGEKGGIGQANRDLLEAFCENEAITEIISIPRRPSGVPETFPSKITQYRAIQNQILYSFYATYIFLRSGKVDIIFCSHLFMAPLAFLLSRMFHVPFWVHLHGTDAWKMPSRIVRHSVESATMVTCVSRYTRKMLLSWAQISHQRARVLANTVHEKFKVGPEPVHLKKKFRLDGKKILLTVGRLASEDQYKGHDLILQVMPELLLEFPNLIYVIAGEGDDQARLQTMVDHLKLNESVRFLGYVREEEMPDLYRMADIFVMPSIGEGFGIVFIEAMACGVPAIGMADDGSVDALVDGKVGVTTSPNRLLKDMLGVLKNAKIDRMQLSVKVQSLFGKKAFERHLLSLMNQVMIKMN